jgi:hypothetical protein
MSYENLNQPKGKFHPDQIAHYVPDIGMSKPKKFTRSKYDGLTDNSSYEQYAWEFLRRNKFYQEMIDSLSAVGKHKSNPLPLEHWGYRQSKDWDFHCGLWQKPYKHYADDYSADLTWYPVEHMRDRMCSVIGKSVQLEDSNTQLQISIDLGHVFGPSVCGLKRQLQVASEMVAKRLEEAAVSVRETNEAPKKDLSKESESQEHIFRSVYGKFEPTLETKEHLRTLLYVADLLTGKRQVKKPIEKRDATDKVPVKSESASILSHPDLAKRIYTATGVKISSNTVSIYAQSAFEYVYQWRCLGLLALPTEVQTEKSEK